VFGKACVCFEGEPWDVKRVSPRKEDRSGRSVCLTKRETALEKACVRVRGIPYISKRVLSVEGNRFLISVCSVGGRSVSD